jgi:hypothetical protein
MALFIIFLVLALSVAAIALAANLYSYGNSIAAAYLALIGCVGLAMSAYVLLQTRRMMMRLKIEVPSVTTIIECKKCGFKSVREFQRGDYIFKEMEPCQKCNEKMIITAIYREIREKKEAFPPLG